jgi:hypothetical protein
MCLSWWSTKSRSSEHTERQTDAISRADRNDRVCALSSSGSDKKPGGRVAALLETGSGEADGVAWIWQHGKVSETEPMVRKDVDFELVGQGEKGALLQGPWL